MSRGGRRVGSGLLLTIVASYGYGWEVGEININSGSRGASNGCPQKVDRALGEDVGIDVL